MRRKPRPASFAFTSSAMTSASAIDVGIVASANQRLFCSDCQKTGSATMLHPAPRHGRAVHGALLVAPPNVDDPEFPPMISGFRPIPRARLPFPSIVVSSSDDWYMDVDDARALAEAWGSRF